MASFVAKASLLLYNEFFISTVRNLRRILSIYPRGWINTVLSVNPFLSKRCLRILDEFSSPPVKSFANYRLDRRLEKRIKKEKTKREREREREVRLIKGFHGSESWSMKEVADFSRSRETAFLAVVASNPSSLSSPLLAEILSLRSGNACSDFPPIKWKWQ